MPTQAKETSAFKDLKKIREVSPAEETFSGTPRVGRPPKPEAKSRHPEYRAWTGYLKKESVMEAEYRLKRAESGKSVSDLLEELLSGWVAKN